MTQHNVISHSRRSLRILPHTQGLRLMDYLIAEPCWCVLLHSHNRKTEHMEIRIQVQRHDIHNFNPQFVARTSQVTLQGHEREEQAKMLR